MQPFHFRADMDFFRDASSRVVEVPNLPDKGSLLDWYAKALEFPDYFGGNWDALDECLRDLSWISERRVVLFHKALPLSSTEQNIYIQVITNAASSWKQGDEHEIVVAFHPDCKQRLE